MGAVFPYAFTLRINHHTHITYNIYIWREISYSKCVLCLLKIVKSGNLCREKSMSKSQDQKSM